jgi:hypothetical protein
MSPDVSVLIAGFALQDLGQIAVRHSHELRLRWGESQPFWRNLLVAARSDDPESLYKLHLYGFQLLGSELFPLCK